MIDVLRLIGGTYGYDIRPSRLGSQILEALEKHVRSSCSGYGNCDFHFHETHVHYSQSFRAVSTPVLFR